MVIDPGTATIIATAIAAAVKGTGDALAGQSAKKAAKRRAKETKRETLGNNLQSVLDRSAELSAHGLKSKSNISKRKSQSFQDTSDLVRGAFNI